MFICVKSVKQIFKQINTTDKFRYYSNQMNWWVIETTYLLTTNDKNRLKLIFY